MYRLKLITEERPQGGIRIRTSEFETLLDNVKLHKASTFHFSYQAELIASLINMKKTYVEVQAESIDTGGVAKVITPYNILSLGKSIITIFLNQITYLAKKLFK